MYYAITNLIAAAPHSPAARLALLREDLKSWTQRGVAYVQLREKTLEAGELVSLARAARSFLDTTGVRVPRLLVNGRADVALAAGADGVHLTSRPGELTPAQVRTVFARSGQADCTISVSCHTAAEVAHARDQGADLVLFGPVFAKVVKGIEVQAGVGLPALEEVCRQAGTLPVLAVGGVTLAEEAACRSCGAAGVAGIRLFARTSEAPST